MSTHPLCDLDNMSTEKLSKLKMAGKLGHLTREEIIKMAREGGLQYRRKDSLIKSTKLLSIHAALIGVSSLSSMAWVSLIRNKMF